MTWHSLGVNRTTFSASVPLKHFFTAEIPAGVQIVALIISGVILVSAAHLLKLL